MKYLLLRNEKSVDEVADRAFKKLSSTQREQAKAALLKANPELKTFNSVRKGFIIRVPKVSEDIKSNIRNLVNPIEEIANELGDNLKTFENSLASRFTDLANRQKDIENILKVASKELKELPKGDAAAKTLKKHLLDSRKLNEKNRKLGLQALHDLQEAAAVFGR